MLFDFHSAKIMKNITSCLIYIIKYVVLAVCTHFFQGPPAVNFTVTGDVIVVADVRETTVADMVMAACLKIQAPPLRGGGAVEDN